MISRRPVRNLLAGLRKKAWKEGSAMQKTQIGALFHPVTLEKLVVFRRGRQNFRTPDFRPD